MKGQQSLFFSVFYFKSRLAVPFYLCQVVCASHFHFLWLLMLSRSNAVQWTQGSQVSVFPDGKLPVSSTLVKVTEGIHFIVKPKNIISCTPCVHDQLTTADEVATKRRQMEKERERQRQSDAVLLNLVHFLGYYTVTFFILWTESF